MRVRARAKIAALACLVSLAGVDWLLARWLGVGGGFLVGLVARWECMLVEWVWDGDYVDCPAVQAEGEATHHCWRGHGHAETHECTCGLKW